MKTAILRGASNKGVCCVILHEKTQHEEGWGWEVMDWQGVKDCEESGENYFRRILLQRGVEG